MLDFAPTTPNLQYYAPEIGRLLSPDTVCANPAKTKEGDVFSFGTLIYLLFIGRLPFEDLETRELLVAVSSGQFSSLLLSLNSNLALIIRLDQGELEGGRNRVKCKTNFYKCMEPICLYWPSYNTDKHSSVLWPVSPLL